jgi:hypothetical protein
MTKRKPRTNERTRQFLGLLDCLQIGALHNSKPDKIVKHEAAQAFPKLAARDIETAFNVVLDRGRGRPSTNKSNSRNCSS